MKKKNIKLDPNEIVKNDKRYKDFAKKFIKHAAKYNRNRSLSFCGLGICLCSLALEILAYFLPLSSTGFLGLILSSVALLISGSVVFCHYTNKNIKIAYDCGLTYRDYEKVKNCEEFKKLKEEAKNEEHITYTYMQNESTTLKINKTNSNKNNERQNNNDLEK